MAMPPPGMQPQMRNSNVGSGDMSADLTAQVDKFGKALFTGVTTSFYGKTPLIVLADTDGSQGLFKEKEGWAGKSITGRGALPDIDRSVIKFPPGVKLAYDPSMANSSGVDNIRPMATPNMGGGYELG